ncbi:MAG TPA: hypothetical protein VMD27_13565 [Candidatus Aquilonibacter sp.]|nr:hypothetical protein [Candidatus Aquilonibacter sp.]
MKLIRTRLVISWLLFAAFLAALWLHFYTVAIFVLFPAIVVARLRIPTPRLSALERRVSWIFAVILLAGPPSLIILHQAFSPALAMTGGILGTILVFAYGIFIDYSKFKQSHDSSA